MTQEQFTGYVKIFWDRGRYSDSYKEYLVEYKKDLDHIATKFLNDYLHGRYTDTINKEVEALWQRRNSKLGKALN